MAKANLMGKERTRLLIKDRVWLTKDNRRLHLTTIDTDHLQNIVNLLERHANQYIMALGLAMCNGPQPHGDGAQMGLDIEMEYLAQTDWKECYNKKALSILLDELNRRNK